MVHSMADEFSTTLSEEMPAARLLAERLVVLGLCEIETIEDMDAQLRWANMPRRVNWPEDIAISISGLDLLVSVYTGASSQRDHLRISIERILKEITGENVVLEEC